MSQADPATDVWVRVAELLQQRIAPADFMSWFAAAEALDLQSGVLTISLANDFAVRWVNDRFRGVLGDIVSEAVGAPTTVALVSRAGAAAEPRRVPSGSDGLPERGAAGHGVAGGMPAGADAITEEQLRAEFSNVVASNTQQAVGAAAARQHAAPGQMALNERYCFDTFVIGEANQLAHAAALSVAESPGQSYNPLFIYGGTGLGKTHLLHAIGHYAMATQPGTTVAYVTTEGFVNQFIQAIRRHDNSRERFKHYFRGIDILLMDDVQFLSGKSPSLQEELFHTFNSLHHDGRQVVLTSDCEPGAIPKLEDRLKSRFAWGLITDIATPDRETRIAILRKKAQADSLSVPTEVLSAIGERVSTNVRELEGALTRVVGYSSLTGRAITIELAARVLDSYLQPNAGPVTIERIQSVVCEHFSLSRDELVGARRSNQIARPRQIAMYLARVLLGAPSTQVGLRFGGRDHTTVLHAERRIDKLIKEDREIYDVVERLTTTIRQGSDSVQHAR